MEDYSAFSWESIQKSWKDTVDEVQRLTGASDDEMNIALSIAAERLMNTNFMKEEKTHD